MNGAPRVSRDQFSSSQLAVFSVKAKGCATRSLVYLTLYFNSSGWNGINLQQVLHRIFGLFCSGWEDSHGYEGLTIFFEGEVGGRRARSAP
jgi:hypothetical protein